jgi:hypothetical protein
LCSATGAVQAIDQIELEKRGSVSPI